MPARIPPRIKPYKGLVAAWKARHGASGNWYDPPRKRRSTRSGIRRRDPDPRRRGIKRGYGVIRGKPYAVGSPGGVYWSGARKPRYDPARVKDYRRRARGWLGRATEKLDKWSPMIGFLTFLGFPMWASYKKYMEEFGAVGGNFLRFIIDGARNEINNLLGLYPPEQRGEANKDPLTFLQWKFTNPHSHWCIPFWGSLVTMIVCKLGVLNIVLPAKVTKIISKISVGGLIASIIGGLFILGSSKPTLSQVKSNPSQSIYCLPHSVNTPPYG